MKYRSVPEWKPPADHGRRPSILRKLSRELTQRLGQAGERLRVRLRNVDLHDGTRRKREMYQERVEACALVLQCLVHYVDVVTLVVGKGEDERFYGLKLSKIAEATGLGERRIDRAVRDLHAAGFLVSKTRAERTKDGFRGLTAVRQLSVELFHALGLGGVLYELQRKVYAKRKGLTAPATAAHLRMATRGREFDNAAAKRRYGRPMGNILGGLSFTPQP